MDVPDFVGAIVVRFHKLTLFVAVLLALAGAAFAQGAPSSDPARWPQSPPPAEPTVSLSLGPSVIEGAVTDVQSGQPLDYANIVFDRRLEGTQIYQQVDGTMSLSGGYFIKRLPPGEYRATFLYIGYEKLVREDLVLAPGETIELSIGMTVEPIEMPQFVVQGTAITNTETASLARQQQSAVVSDAITAEQMSRGTDSDAAEAVERVTGVSVVDGKYVFVRGLGDRYSATLLNGAGLPSPEPNKRTIPLDIFPSNLLDNIVIQKTYTPDMEGEFGGGTIQIETREVVDRREMSQKLSYGVSTNVLDMGFLDYHGGSTDFLARDDGTRELPEAIKTKGARLSPPFVERTELRELKNEFTNVWKPTDHGTVPNLAFAGHYADRFSLLGRRGGFQLAASLSNSAASRTRSDNEYRDGTVLYRYTARESESSMLGGLTSSLSYQIRNSDRIKATFLHTRSADDRSRIADGLNNDFGADVLQYQLAYVERSLTSTIVTGRHDVLGARLQWLVSDAEARRKEPDRRSVVYEENPDGTLKLSRLQFPFTRLFGDSHEDDRSAKADLTVFLPSMTGFEEWSLKVGWSYHERRRESQFRRFGIKCPTRCGDQNQDPEMILDPESPDIDRYWVEETTRANDEYDADQYVRAGYAMVDWKMPKGFRFTGGARLEQGTQSVDALSPFALETEGTRERRDETDVLPGANATWSFTPRQNLRVSYSKTLNRPELRELVDFDMYNFETGYSETGNPKLRQATIDAYDVRWEFYPAPTHYVSASFFYKELDEPIERTVDANTGGARVQPLNGDQGFLRGFELELRTSLADLLDGATSGALRPGAFWQQFGFTGNYSRIWSTVHVDVDPTEQVVTRVVPLQGQSESALNLGLFYSGRRMDAGLQYKAFGTRLFSVALGENFRVYEEPGATLDATWACQIGWGLKVKLSGENLTDNEVLITQEVDGERQRWQPGRKYGVSLSYSY